MVGKRLANIVIRSQAKIDVTKKTICGHYYEGIKSQVHVNTKEACKMDQHAKTLVVERR